MIANKTANEWFTEYGMSHKHKTNELIHWFAVPIIFLTTLGMLWDIPAPSNLLELGFNWTYVGIAFSIIFLLVMLFVACTHKPNFKIMSHPKLSILKML